MRKIVCDVCQKELNNWDKGPLGYLSLRTNVMDKETTAAHDAGFGGEVRFDELCAECYNAIGNAIAEACKKINPEMAFEQ